MKRKQRIRTFVFPAREGIQVRVILNHQTDGSSIKRQVQTRQTLQTVAQPSVVKNSMNPDLIMQEIEHKNAQAERMPVQYPRVDVKQMHTKVDDYDAALSSRSHDSVYRIPTDCQ